MSVPSYVHYPIQMFETFVDDKTRNMNSDQEEDFKKSAWLVYWFLNVGNFMFLICFGLLMFGVHGKRQSPREFYLISHHHYFYPMIVMEWVSAGIVILIASLVWIGWFRAISLQNYLENLGYYFHVDATLPALSIPIVAVYIMFPIYYTFRVHVKEVTKYSSFV